MTFFSFNPIKEFYSMGKGERILYCGRRGESMIIVGGENWILAHYEENQPNFEDNGNKK